VLEAGVDLVVVADNGSRDRTAERALAAGARVVRAERKGYGSACQAGVAALPPAVEAVLFCDADGADDLRRLNELVEPVLQRRADLVIGARTQGESARRALSLPQRAGNRIASAAMRRLYGVEVTDLGPFRCISNGALRRLEMSDPGFGWTAEMQVKAYRLGLRVRELSVTPLPRTSGVSKISGNPLAVLRAGRAILWTILRYHRCELRALAASEPTS
jgi:glycosyltransferase involved in cell wall biosynthesis